MKKLLSTLSVAIIGASSGSLIASNITINQESGTFVQEEYWNSAHTIEIRQAKAKGTVVGQSPAMYLGLYNFNLGTSPNFTHFNFLDRAIGYVNWGSKEYGRWDFQSFDFTYDEGHNYQLKNTNDEKFFFYLKYKLFDEKYTVVFASLIARTYFGYTWYMQNNEYHFQFLVFEYVTARNSRNPGINEINLGRGLSFS